MNIVTVNEEINPTKYVIVTSQLNIDETLTSRVLVADSINPVVNVVEVSRGLQGLQGVPGENGVVFDILPVISGGTNNNNFETDKIIYYDGNKLTSSAYTLSDIVTGGVVGGTGIVTIAQNGSISVNSNLGEGLTVNEHNQLVVDFNAINTSVLAQITYTAGSGLIFDSNNTSYNIGRSEDIIVNDANIELSEKGTPGIYTKIQTDTKGRVVSGSNLTKNDIESMLGYVPWRSSNDGADSGLDADKLDSYHASFFRDAANLTGTLDKALMPISTPNSVMTKIILDENGAISSLDHLSYADITGILSYPPVNATGDIIDGLFVVNGSVFGQDGIKLNDNLPIFALNHYSINFNDLRGFRFLYGESLLSPKTGIFGYDYSSNELKLIVEDDIYVILNDQLANDKYAQFDTDNVFGGNNTFHGQTTFDVINVSGFNITSTNLISNLNANFLQDEDKSYYRNATNLTGILNETDYVVTLSNISGFVGVVPIFDDRTQNPSRTVSDSIMRQELDSVIKIDSGNFTVGIDNFLNINTSNGSILAGNNNFVSGDLGFVFGAHNVIDSNGSGSIVIGQSGIASHPNSVVLGKNGQTYSDNQLVYGIFAHSGETAAGKGAYTTIGLGFNGTAGSYQSMIPAEIPIVQNNTLIYDLDVLINKLGSNSVAAFRFSSGVVKNLNRFAEQNPGVVENITLNLANPVKNELYNNTYLREYPVYLKASTSEPTATSFKVDDPENFDKYVLTENLPPKSLISTIKPIEINGIYRWDEGNVEYYSSNKSNISITLDDPKTKGYFLQNFNDQYIWIYTYNHGAEVGDWINVAFDYSSQASTKRYKVVSVIDKDTIRVEKEKDVGIATDYTTNNDAYDILFKTNIYDEKYNDYSYQFSNKVHLTYSLNNNNVYSHISDVSGLLYNPEQTIITGIVITGLNPLNFNTIYAPHPIGPIYISPIAERSGQCVINALEHMDTENTNVVKSDRITEYNTINVDEHFKYKVYYKQYASDPVTGYSTIEISGIDLTRLDYNTQTQYYYWSSDADDYTEDLSNLQKNRYSDYANVHISYERPIYCNFGNYLDVSYSTTGINSEVSGVLVDAKLLDLGGDSNISGTTLLPEGASTLSGTYPIFITKINQQDISDYYIASGLTFPEQYMSNKDKQIFIPFDISSISDTGTIEFIESGSYKNGQHPKNVSVLPNIINNEHNVFSGYIKYDYPTETGYTISGYADVFPTPIYTAETTYLPFLNIVGTPELAPARTLVNETISMSGEKFNVFATPNLVGTPPAIFKQTYYPNKYAKSIPPRMAFDRDHGYREYNGGYPAFDNFNNNKYCNIPVVFDGSIDSAIFNIAAINNRTLQLSYLPIRNNTENNQFHHVTRPIYGDQEARLSSYVVAEAGSLTGIVFRNKHECIDHPIPSGYIKVVGVIDQLGRITYVPNGGDVRSIIRPDITYGPSIELDGNTYAFTSDDLSMVVYDDNYQPYPTGESGTLLWNQYKIGSCYIPQNTINYDINVSYKNLGNRWGQKYEDGSLISTSFTKSFFATKNINKCNSDEYCFQIYGFNISEFTPGESVYLSFDPAISGLNNVYTINDIAFYQRDYSGSSFENQNPQALYVSEKSDIVEQHVNTITNGAFCGFVQVTKNHTDSSIMNTPPNIHNIFLTPRTDKFRHDTENWNDIDTNIYKTGISQFNWFNNKYFHTIETNIVGNLVGPYDYQLDHVPNTGQYLIETKAPTGHIYNDSTLTDIAKINLLINSIYQIKIDKVSWKYLDPQDGWKPYEEYDYAAASETIVDSNLFAYSDTTIEIHLQTKFGTLVHDSSITLAPRYNIFGISDYSLSSGYHDAQYNTWHLYILARMPSYETDRAVTISVEDYSGTDSVEFDLFCKPRLKVANTGSPAYSADGISWQKLIGIYNTSDPGLIGYEYDSALKCNYYLWSSEENLTSITDYPSNQFLQLPSVMQTTNNADDAFKVIVNGDGSQPFFYSDCNNFILPILIANDAGKIDHTNDTLSAYAYGNGISVSNISISNSSHLKKFVAKISFSVDNPGIYTLNFDLTSAQLGNIYSDQCSVVVSPPLDIDTQVVRQPVTQYMSEPWSVYFYVNGVDGYSPQINVSNLPINGYYSSGRLPDTYVLNQYDIGNYYSDVYNKRVINVTGVNNFYYDNYYARQTGDYPLSILVDDNHSYKTGILLLRILDKPKITNLLYKNDTYFNQKGNLNFNSNTTSITIDEALSDIVSFNDKNLVQKDNGLYDIKLTTSNPIDYIYDASIDIVDNFDLQPNDQGTANSLRVTVRGILNDKIYAVGKLNTLEVKTDAVLRAPLRILGVNQQYDFDAAAEWSIEFNVCGGIASPEYPPIVTIENVPNGSGTVRQCLINHENPSWCELGEKTTFESPISFKSREFREDTGCWAYEFKGQPDCQLTNSLFNNVLVTARDSIDDETILETATATTVFIYGSFAAQPSPLLILEDLSDGKIFPNCFPVSYSWSTSIVDPSTECPIATGLSQFYLYGDLPSGLTVNFNSMTDLNGLVENPPNPSRYTINSGIGSHDLGSGYYYIVDLIETNIAAISGNIVGTVTEFFPGTKIISGVSTDLLGNTSLTSISLTVSTEPMENPVRHGVLFFDSDKPVYIPEPTNFLDPKFELDNILGINYPPDPESLEYRSLFNDQNGAYSGLYYTNQIQGLITITGVNRTIDGLVTYSDGSLNYDNVYIKFLGPSNSNDIFLGRVAEQATDYVRIYGTINPVSSNSPEACVFCIPKITTDLFSKLTASPPLSRQDHNTLMCGSITESSQGTVLTGWVQPSYEAHIYFSGLNDKYPYFNVQSLTSLSVEHLLRPDVLTIEPIDGVCCEHARTPITYTNCYETGVVRLSGIVLPKPSIDITDINYSFQRLQPLSLAIRISYGNNLGERNIPENYRGPAQNILPTGRAFRLDRYEGVNIRSLQISNAFNSNAYTSDFTESVYGTGAVYGVELSYGPSTSFPTYDINAIPYIQNNTYFSYYAFEQDSQPNNRDNFPPYIPVFDNTALSYHEETSITGVSGLLIGGFVGNSSYDNEHLQHPSEYSEYPPIVSGYLSSPLYSSYSGYLNTLYDEYNNISYALATTNLNVDQEFSDNDYSTVSIIYKSSNGITPPEPFITGLQLQIDIANHQAIMPTELNSQINNDVDYLTIQACARYSSLTESNVIINVNDGSIFSTNDRLNIRPIVSGINSQAILGVSGYIEIDSIDENLLTCNIYPESLLNMYYASENYVFIDKIIDSSIINIELTNFSTDEIRCDLGVNISDFSSLTDHDYQYHITTLDNPSGSPFVNNVDGWEPIPAGRTYPLYIDKTMQILNNPTDTSSATFVSSPFYIKYGKRPLIDNKPYIVRLGSCDWDYTISYNDYLDMLVVNYVVTNTYSNTTIRIVNDVGEAKEVIIT